MGLVGAGGGGGDKGVVGGRRVEVEVEEWCGWLASW